ncbi:hypothetical protein HDU88_001618 [Geranomyces variabilis]|nr:hypothetical protein HDU88_001618 [Geranomyces variabilis]
MPPMVTGTPGLGDPIPAAVPSAPASTPASSVDLGNKVDTTPQCIAYQAVCVAARAASGSTTCDSPAQSVFVGCSKKATYDYGSGFCRACTSTLSFIDLKDPVIVNREIYKVGFRDASEESTLHDVDSFCESDCASGKYYPAAFKMDDVMTGSCVCDKWAYSTSHSAGPYPMVPFTTVNGGGSPGAHGIRPNPNAAAQPSPSSVPGVSGVPGVVGGAAVLTVPHALAAIPALAAVWLS